MFRVRDGYVHTRQLDLDVHIHRNPRAVRCEYAWVGF